MRSEPLLQPQLEAIIGQIHQLGAITTLITDGYLLNWRRIERLDPARLDYLAIRIDNLKSHEVSKSSLRGFDQRLQKGVRNLGMTAWISISRRLSRSSGMRVWPRCCQHQGTKLCSQI